MTLSGILVTQTNFTDGLAYGPPSLTNYLHQPLHRQTFVTMSPQSGSDLL